jgi:hypothetical protein
MSLNGFSKRVEKLEAVQSVGAPCRDCGRIVGAPVTIGIDTSYSDRGERPPPSDLRRCGRCGSLSGSFTFRYDGDGTDDVARDGD